MALYIIFFFAILFNFDIANGYYERATGMKQISGILCALADFDFAPSSNPGRAITLLLITNNASSISSVNIDIAAMHWGNEFPPLEIRTVLNSNNFSAKGSGIIAVTPADFDSDGYVDLLIVKPTTSINLTQTYKAYIFWRNNSVLDDSTSYMLPMDLAGQPFLFDLDANLKPDLLVQPVGNSNSRQAYFFNQRTITNVSMPSKWINGSTFQQYPFSPKSSHAYASLGALGTSGDKANTFNADLLVTSYRPGTTIADKPTYMFERWRRQTKQDGFKSLPSSSGQVADYLKLESVIELSYTGLQADAIVGPSLLVDVDATGTMKLIVPVCFTNSCASGAILLYDATMGVWQNVFTLPWSDGGGQSWRFPTPAEQSALLSPAWTSAGFDAAAIASPSLVAGDADLNGRPDLLTVLVNADPAKPNDRRVLLLSYDGVRFQPNIKLLKPRDSSQATGLDASIPGAFSATFYDVSDDGHLDILLNIVNTSTKEPELQFYQQFATTSYFLKVTVLGCSKDSKVCSTTSINPYGQKAYGAYSRLNTQPLTHDQLLTGEAQQPQNSQLQLSSPYSLFGLTDATNAVDNLYITVPYTDSSQPRFKTLSAVFPNTQLVVLCMLASEATGDCDSWDVRLYLARSFWREGRFIAVLSVIVGTLLINVVLIALLQWREMKEDRKDRLAEFPYLNPT